MNPLREKMLRAMKLRRFASSTQTAYVNAVKGLAGHYHQWPDKISDEKIQDYLLHMLYRA